jgi:hypothetical protein
MTSEPTAKAKMTKFLNDNDWYARVIGRNSIQDQVTPSTMQ